MLTDLYGCASSFIEQGGSLPSFVVLVMKASWTNKSSGEDSRDLMLRIQQAVAQSGIDSSCDLPPLPNLKSVPQTFGAITRGRSFNLEFNNIQKAVYSFWRLSITKRLFIHFDV